MKRLFDLLVILLFVLGPLHIGCGSSELPAGDSVGDNALVIDELNEEHNEDPKSDAIQPATPTPLETKSTEKLEEIKERSVQVELLGPMSFEVYERVELKVNIADDRTEIRFLSLPDGMVYKEGRLMWTPGGDQVGIHQIQARAKNGQLRKEYEFRIDVVRTPFDVPFDVRRIALASDGTQAFVWGAKWRDVKRFLRSEKNHEYQMAVVDLASRTVKVIGVPKRPISRAWFTSDAIYVVLNNTEQGYPVEIQQLSPSDLSQVKSIFTKVAPDFDGWSTPWGTTPSWTLLSNQFLIIDDERFRLPDLVSLSESPVETDELFNKLFPKGLCSRGIGDLVYHEGIYWNQDLSKAKLLLHPARFIRGPEYQPRLKYNGTVKIPWGGRMKEGELVDSDNKTVLYKDNKSTGLRVLSQLPAICKLSSEVSLDNGPKQSHLTIHRIDSGEMTQRLVLGNIPSNANRRLLGNVDFQCAGDVIAACINGQLHVVSVYEIDRKLLPSVFRIGFGQTMVIKSTGKTKVNYDVLNGTPPYQLKLNIGNQEFTATSSENASISVQTDELVAKMHKVTLQALYQAVGKDGKPRNRVLDYIEYVTPLFRKVTGRAPKGVPVVVPAELKVTDAEFRSDTISHAFLIELPIEELVLQVEDRVASARDWRAKQQQKRPSRPVVRKSTASKKKKATTSRPVDSEKISKKAAENYLAMLHRKYPSNKVETDSLDRTATEALAAVDKAFEQVLQKKKNIFKGGKRRWVSQNGYSTTAMLQDVFADQVVLMSPEGKQMTVPLEKLSDKSQEFVKNYLQITESNRPTEYLPAQMEHLLACIKTHKAKRFRYPPAYLTDESGQPNLSWRVLLLPFLGGEELFSLFRLDEPWDSPHNRCLIEFMPAVYKSLDPQVNQGKTSILALRGKNALLSNEIPRSTSDNVDSLASIPLLVEVKHEKAVEWTKPDDFALESGEKVENWLQFRQEEAYVGMANSKVKLVPAGLPLSKWQTGINCNDGEEPDFSIDESDHQIAESLQQSKSHNSKKSRNRLAKRQPKYQLERLPPGSFVIGKAQPDQTLIGKARKVDGGFEVRTIPFSYEQEKRRYTCVVSPKGIVYGFKGDAIVEFDPKSGRIKKQGKLLQEVTSIQWSAGMLVLTRETKIDLQKLYSGEWKKVVGKPNKDLLTQNLTALEAWLVDPKTFNVRRGYLLPGSWLSCATDSTKALTVFGNSFFVHHIGLVDLRRGELLSIYPPFKIDEDSSQKQIPYVDWHDVLMLPDGESAVAIGRNRLHRIEMPSDQLSITESSPLIRYNDQNLSLGYNLSSNGKFIGIPVRNSRDKRLRGKSGFLIFSTESLEQPYGAISTSFNGPKVLGLDSDSNSVLLGLGYPGGLRVIQDKKQRTLEDIPSDPTRILAAPNSDAVFLFYDRESYLVSVDGKAEQWAFQPAPETIGIEKLGFKAKTPQEPFRFVESNERPGEMVLDVDMYYEEARFSPDGKYFYLQEFKDGVISCFDSKSCLELRRQTFHTNYSIPMLITKLGVLVNSETEHEYQLLDFQSLDGKLTFALEDAVALAASPNSHNIASITETGDLRINDLSSGKLMTEIPWEDQMQWESSEVRSSRRRPLVHRPRSIRMSQDGNFLVVQVKTNHILRLSGNKIEYVCRAPSGYSRLPVISPLGKFLALGGGQNKRSNNSSKVFTVPNMANAAAIMNVEIPIVVDDEGRIYGTVGNVPDHFDDSYANSNIAIYDLDGEKLYYETERRGGRGSGKISELLLHPSRPNLLLVRSGSSWHLVDTALGEDR